MAGSSTRSSFLKTNPRAAAYDPPELPRVEILTETAPLQYGAADGAALLVEEGGAGIVYLAPGPRHRPARHAGRR